MESLNTTQPIEIESNINHLQLIEGDLSRILANDEEYPFINIAALNTGNVRSYGEALLQNTVAEMLDVRDASQLLDTYELDPLLYFIANSQSLGTVCLSNLNPHNALIDRFLRAICENHRIKMVRLSNTMLPTYALNRFLYQICDFVNDVALRNIKLEETDGVTELHILRTILSRHNPLINYLEISWAPATTQTNSTSLELATADANTTRRTEVPKQLLKLKENVLRLENLDNARTRLVGRLLTENTFLQGLELEHASRWTIEEQQENITRDLDPLLVFVKNNPRLQFCTFQGATCPLVTSSFLVAFSQNLFLRKIKLTDLAVSSALLSCLLVTTQSYLQELSLHSVLITDPHNLAPASTILSKRLLTRVSVSSTSPAMLVDTLTHLQRYCNILEFKLNSEDHLVALSNSLQSFIQATETLEVLRLQIASMFEVPTLGPICEGIRQSCNLQKLQFQDCCFTQDCIPLVNQLVSNDSVTVESLEFAGWTEFTSTPLSTVVAGLLEVKHPKSSLDEISLNGYGQHASEDFSMTQMLQPLIQIEKTSCHLNHLDLDRVCQVETLEELIVAIPKICGLKEITLAIENYSEDMTEATKRLVRAFRKNRSLLDIDYFCFLPYIGYGKDQLILNMYCSRNRSMSEIVKQAEAVNPSLWPRIYQTTLQYEHRSDIIFQSLVSLSGTSSCPSYQYQHKRLKRSSSEGEDRISKKVLTASNAEAKTICNVALPTLQIRLREELNSVALASPLPRLPKEHT